MFSAEPNFLKFQISRKYNKIQSGNMGLQEKS